MKTFYYIYYFTQYIYIYILIYDYRYTIYSYVYFVFCLYFYSRCHYVACVWCPYDVTLTFSAGIFKQLCHLHWKCDWSITQATVSALQCFHQILVETLLRLTVSHQCVNSLHQWSRLSCQAAGKQTEATHFIGSCLTHLHFHLCDKSIPSLCALTFPWVRQSSPRRN